jgi:hypothetical protein
LWQFQNNKHNHLLFLRFCSVPNATFFSAGHDARWTVWVASHSKQRVNEALGESLSGICIGVVFDSMQKEEEEEENVP